MKKETELDARIADIRENLFPENVFTDEQLIAWARRRHTPLEIFPLKALKDDIEEAKMESIRPDM